MDSLTVTVPAEQQSDIDSWQDGQQYNLVVKQTSPGQFELVSSSDAETAAENGGEGGESDNAGGDMHENPAVAVVMMKKKGA